MAPKNTRKIAVQRIETLYRVALETVHEDPELAKRYVQLLRRIAQRTRTHLPLHVRRGICRKCDTVLIPGYNSHTRLKQRREPHIAITCQSCGNITRIPMRERP